MEQKYTLNDKNLKFKNLSELTKDNPEHQKLIKSAKSNFIWGKIIGSIGGGLIGWPLGTAIGGGEPEWILAGIGAGLFVASIPLTISSNRKLKTVVDGYNNSISLKKEIKPSNLSLLTTTNGIGLQLKF